MEGNHNYFDAYRQRMEIGATSSSLEDFDGPLAQAKRMYQHVYESQFNRVYNMIEHINFVTMSQQTLVLARSCFCVAHLERDTDHCVGKIIIKFPTRWGCTLKDKESIETISQLFQLYPDFSMDIEEDFIVFQFKVEFFDREQVHDYSEKLAEIQAYIDANEVIDNVIDEDKDNCDID